MPGLDSSNRAVVVVGPGEVPKDGRKVIVTEGRSYEAVGDGGLVSTVKTKGYKAGADLYLRSTDEVQFPATAKVLTLGVDLMQARTAGFSRTDGEVNVGPAHIAFAAANLAWRLGATVIEIVGLSTEEKALLKPWLDELSTHPVDPAPVTVTLS